MLDNEKNQKQNMRALLYTFSQLTNILLEVASFGLPEDIPSENLYVYNGDTANLVCPYMSMENSAQWRGPVGLTVYTDAGRIKNSLTNYGRLQVVFSNVTGESNLLISTFSETDEGLYRCITMLNGTAVHKDFMVILFSKYIDF